MYKKISFLFIFAVLAFGVFNPNIASAKYQCGAYEQKCAEASMSYGDQQYAASSRVYFSYGETIRYDWDNDAPSMQVSFQVYNSSGAPFKRTRSRTGLWK
ncbi:hypothetical protein [Halobacillus karajensis]|uniref:Secreted protein n=1 Tax=Halobacillus karajensis TaxID=195088 RepID=A0A024P4K4_9BACI|nr:hypothetical protein [Halobacillus karajensis]CDQ20862.1 hypothetical protein BN982_03217 [Halobacillus karajensis]CDQ23668.1 hypothetical protein BN983_01919 [Halobacillus karajensis]CDQ27146.1 hypothetical protein BN981_01400 [Halobacillus karajensis]